MQENLGMTSCSSQLLLTGTGLGGKKTENPVLLKNRCYAIKQGYRAGCQRILLLLCRKEIVKDTSVSPCICSTYCLCYKVFCMQYLRQPLCRRITLKCCKWQV